MIFYLARTTVICHYVCMENNNKKGAADFLGEYKTHLTKFFQEGESLKEPEKRLLANLVVEVDSKAKTELEQDDLSAYKHGRDEFRREFFQKLYE